MKLNQKTVDALVLPEGKTESFFWDDSLKGFGVRLWGERGRAYVIQYRIGSQTRRFKVGDPGLMKYAEAVTRAKSLLLAVEKGEDPSAEKQARLRAVTLANFWTDVAKPHLTGRVKASSLGWYEDIWNKHLEPHFGTQQVERITRRDVLRYHAALHNTPYAANRALAALRSICNIAIEHGVIATNPCARLKRYTEKARERFLSPEETAALVKALDAEEQAGRYSPHAMACIRFLLYSGLRKNEAVTLRWDAIDLAHRVAHLTDTKSGARTLALSAPLVRILEAQDAIRTAGNPYVFEGRGRGGRVGFVDTVWRIIRTNAEMPDLRIHDLRHNAATQGALLGLSGPLLKTLMGHRDQATTARYIHLAGGMDPVLAAAEALGAAIQEAAAGGQKVVEVPPREIDNEADEGTDEAQTTGA